MFLAGVLFWVTKVERDLIDISIPRTLIEEKYESIKCYP